MTLKAASSNEAAHHGFKLRRALSAHEIAALLRLRNTPGQAMTETPDVVALQEVGLVQTVASEHGGAGFTLTAEGRTVLRVLGAEQQSAWHHAVSSHPYRCSSATP